MRSNRSLAWLLLIVLLCSAAAPGGRAAASADGVPATASAASAAIAAMAPSEPGAPVQPESAAGTAGTAEDPVLWPEAQRAFFQDGPQLLLADTQRNALAHMDSGARQHWIDEFLARPPGNGTAAAVLVEGIARRQALAVHQFISPEDVRAQLLFLNGAPSARNILDCGTTFKPIEVWTYRNGTEAGSVAGSIVVFRPVEDEPFRAWSPSDGKRQLYSAEMEYWMEQWGELHGLLSGKRFDLRLCKEATLIDSVTGVPGLSGARAKDERAAAERQSYARRPGGQPGEGLLDPPGDLAVWARQAAATKLPAGAAPLSVPSVELQFPERIGQRIVVRAVVQAVANGRIAGEDASAAGGTPAAATNGAPAAGAKGTITPATNGTPAGATNAAPAAGAKGAITPAGAPGAATTAGVASATAAQAGAGGQQVGLTVEGAVEEAGRVFDTFRLRYKLPAPGAGQPVTIAVDRSLRPHRAFVLRMKIRDDANGAEALVARGFVVPGAPVAVAQPPMASLPADVQQRRQAQLVIPKDSVTLMPPEDDVVFGLWRAEALVTGDRIAKVAFAVDDKVQFSRHTGPYTVELRLNRLPTEQVVRADGYDAQGQLVASDRLVLNQPHGGLAVSIQEPARGARPTGKVKAVAEVTVPSERRVESVEFRVNDAVVAKLTQPPWTTEIAVPANVDTVYLTVSAKLDDGSRAEDVRFLRSPNFVEEVAVNIIELYTTVVDGAGQLVRGLTADDFQVLENGQPQTLAKFELVENLPLTLGILIDTSGSMESSLGEAQHAAGAFLERMVRPGDRCFTLTFSDRPVVRMPLTDDPRAAAQSLERLQADGSTSIHDALVHSLYYFRGTRGQRAIVLLSDGDDNTSQLTFDEALEYAKRSGVAIYTIGLNIPVHSIGIRGKLNHLSEVTGGKVFYVSKAAELSGIYGEIERELRSRYLLAFQTAQQAAAGGYRQIEVKMRKDSLKARTARGYYP